jgi:glutathione S-transferase
MKLYYSDVLAPRKPGAAIRLLGLPVEEIYLDFTKAEHKAPAYLAINPNGKVPTLTDGDRSIWEANAIMCYLSRKAGADLSPQDDRAIDIQRWQSWDLQHFTRYGGTLYFEYIIKARFGIAEPDRAEVDEATRQFRRFAGILDDHLTGRTWLVGDSLTVADLSVAVTLPFAADAHIPLGEFPAVARWHDRLMALEAWANPLPVRPETVAV